MSYPQGPHPPPVRGPHGTPPPGHPWYSGAYPMPRTGPNAGVIMLICTVSVIFVIVAAVVGGVWYLNSVSPTAGPGADGGTVPERFDGTWSGDLTQYGSDDSAMGTWHLTMTFDGQSVEAEESSEDFGYEACPWRVGEISANDGDVRFTYATVGGADQSCAPSGEVLLRHSGADSLGVTVSTDFQGQTSMSEGTLRRH